MTDRFAAVVEKMKELAENYPPEVVEGFNGGRAFAARLFLPDVTAMHEAYEQRGKAIDRLTVDHLHMQGVIAAKDAEIERLRSDVDKLERALWRCGLFVLDVERITDEDAQ